MSVFSHSLDPLRTFAPDFCTANRFLEREAGDFNNPVDARSSGARSPDRARAHRRAGRLLVGSDLNAAGEATGRISGFVMLYLAAGCLGVVE